MLFLFWVTDLVVGPVLLMWRGVAAASGRAEDVVLCREATRTQIAEQGQLPGLSPLFERRCG